MGVNCGFFWFFSGGCLFLVNKQMSIGSMGGMGKMGKKKRVQKLAKV
jgi:hypothetical protein